MSGVGLFELARELQRARSFNELLEILQPELARATGYQHCWLCVTDTVESRSFRLVTEQGISSQSTSALFPIDGDPMLEELFRGNHIVVVEDARTDPRTNKAIVAAMGNRTIVNVPLAIVDKAFAVLGMGTFGDEPVLPPTPEVLAYLTSISAFISVAASRLRLDERTRQAAGERLEIERKLARIQRMDSIGVLAGGVAHDFNNLITVIVASTSMARTATDLAEVREYLDGITDAADRAQALTKQLLAMSRAQQLSLQDVDPVELLSNLVPLLRRVIPSTIVIDLIAPALGVLVEADPTQLDQVIMNLCLNARDAMPKGGKINIEAELVLINGAFRETHPWAVPGRYLLVSVSDTGVGISKDQMDRIYEPFFTTKGEFAGTGLGLAVAHGIVQQRGGMLHCESELGVGTTFRMYLPQLARAARVAGTKIERAATGGTERILVGEDDPGVRYVVQLILERAGYEVVLVRNGQEVLDTLATMKFSLVLLDVVMPGLPAAETIGKIRDLYPLTALLVSSGYPADANISDLLRDQRVAFLPKPYDPERLLRAIRTELDGDAAVSIL